MGAKLSQLTNPYPTNPYRKLRPKFPLIQPLGATQPIIDNKDCGGMCAGRRAYQQLPPGLKTRVDNIIASHEDFDIRTTVTVTSPNSRHTGRRHTGRRGDDVHKFIRAYESTRPYEIKGDRVLLLDDGNGAVTLMLLDVSDPDGLAKVREARLAGKKFDEFTRHLVLAALPTEQRAITFEQAQKFATENNMFYLEGTHEEIIQRILQRKAEAETCYYCQIMSQIGGCPNDEGEGCAFCRVGVMGPPRFGERA